jgi:hypothetical protein
MKSNILESQRVHELVVAELHTGNVAHLTHAVEIGPGEMVLMRTPADTAVGKHVWLEFTIDVEPIKVLARVVGRTLETTRYRFKHMWPADKERFTSYLCSAAAA